MIHRRPVAVAATAAVVLTVGAAAFAVARALDPAAHVAVQKSITLPEVDRYDITQATMQGIADLDITTAEMEVGGRTIERYLYADSASEDVHGAGVPIVVDVGQRLQIDVRNSTDTATNIHWHGMSVPNDQDGPGILIEPGQEHRYEFTAARAGTYWYHSHERPVRDQVDRGMYAPFIVREPADARYDLDQVLVLDDWVVDRTTGHMEVVGDVDTVNGRTGDDIEPISITAGQIAKLRLVNASTAKTQNLTFPLDVRVTHTDGAPLVEPYSTRRLSIAPGERYDVELAPVGDLSSGLSITNERDNGMTIPVHYTASDAPAAVSPFIPPAPSALAPDLVSREPDIEMVLADAMAMSGGMGMAWTINGDVFPDAETFDVQVGRTYVVRFRNAGRHRMDHPMHVHGAHFRVLSTDGRPLEREVWKDTVTVPPDSYVDVAVTFDQPGTWMVHCHILDHEDAGMMTSITAT
ncbi:putative oxidase (copper-binding protein) [Cellulomonas hominis]|uniref:FtsP/CotA-like multicopper oxidase with cupredoxin domain n=1 Tax=Cellulomonas hominis TaxID=156981 RepID=A0A511FHH1_9CELL|nr:FtsP/CotA-like multicopper oxidase with cupredoxin domain [Cellulomonas hominis]NKY05869.1 multicopper oxidase family protein [Cellulomonas hominis]NKY11901.1 multicopper oxidase family protein [Cellulomonas hominis]GEL48686.1 putative oxidase (copper-binding protein) [Cellulomonas hominis]